MLLSITHLSAKSMCNKKRVLKGKCYFKSYWMALTVASYENILKNIKDLVQRQKGEVGRGVWADVDGGHTVGISDGGGGDMYRKPMMLKGNLMYVWRM